MSTRISVGRSGTPRKSLNLTETRAARSSRVMASCEAMIPYWLGSSKTPSFALSSSTRAAAALSPGSSSTSFS